MAGSLVVRPGHVALRVLEMDAAVHYYTNILGLVETDRDDKGRVYLKGWNEHDHHSVVLREADSPGMDYFGFRVRSTEALTILTDRLRAADVPVEIIPAGEHKHCGERVRFEAPSGHFFELYAEKDKVGNGLPLINPDPWPDGLLGIHPTHFDHCLLYGREFDATVRLFMDVLDFDLVEDAMDGEERVVAFLSCSNKAHDVAFIKNDQQNKLHHVSFHVDGWHDLLRAGDILGKHRVPVDTSPTRHGFLRGETMYFYDPSGNRNEVFSGGYIWYSDMPTVTWTMDEIQRAIFFHQGTVEQRYLQAVT